MLKEIISFIKRPQIGYESESLINQLKENAYILVFHLILGILCTFPSILIKVIFRIQQSSLAFFETQPSTLNIVLINLVFIPLVEELVFRLSLVYRLFHIALSLALTITALLFYLNIEFQFNALILIIPFCIIFVFIYVVLTRNKKLNLRFMHFWTNNFRSIFYFSFLTFGYMHLVNYKIGIFIFVFSPILILPQLFSGIIYGFVRIKYGFVWCVIQHVAYNFILSIPELIISK